MNININDNFLFNLNCTYKLIDDIEESNILYNVQFLQFLNLNKYNYEDVYNKIHILYKFLNNNYNNKDIIDIYNTIYENNTQVIDMFLNLDNNNKNKYEYCLYLLLTYDYLHLTIEYLYKLTNNICTKITVKKILDYIKNDINQK